MFYVRWDVHTAAFLKIQVLWGVMSCQLLSVTDVLNILWSFETVVTVYQLMWDSIPVDLNVHIFCIHYFGYAVWS